MPGRALEVAVATTDIRRSFDYWTRLGFGSALTSDAFSHPYGVMTAPRLNVGLHALALPASPLVTLVRPDVAGLEPLLEERGVEAEDVRLGSESLNELQFADPSGLRVRVLEARTFSPPAAPPPPLPGRFDSLSWPVVDEAAVEAFWARLHVDCAPAEDDWASLRADLGGQSLTWHPARVSPEPLLVFRHPYREALRAALAAANLVPLARGTGLARPHLVLGTPEGLRLVILA